MFHAKLDQAVHELRFAARFLGKFQAAQSFKLNIKIAHFAGALAKPLQQFQEFFLAAAADRDQFFKQSLQAQTRSAKAVDALRILPGREFKQGSLRLPERQLALFRSNRHSEKQILLQERTKGLTKYGPANNSSRIHV
jgi:hypothetical protein